MKLLPSVSRSWRLAPGVHAVAADDDLVILDVSADAYFCLPGGARAFILRADRSVSIDDPGLAAELQAAGLIDAVAVIPLSSERPAPESPRASAVRTLTAPPSAVDLYEAAICAVDVAFSYRRRSFAELVDRAARYPVRPSGPLEPLSEVVDRFHRWIPFAPVSAKCLLRSHMLLRLLRRKGHDAQWVFGVATWPFRAHCWLQVGETVLDDSLEHLAPFHPIMVV